MAVSVLSSTGAATTSTSTTTSPTAAAIGWASASPAISAATIAASAAQPKECVRLAGLPMSRRSKVNPDHYKTAGRLAPGDLARERIKQRPERAKQVEGRRKTAKAQLKPR